MDTFDIFRAGCFIFALLFHGALWVGLFKAWRRDRRFERVLEPALEPALEPSGGAPLVSVIIPAHNEASCLPALLESLCRQDYPAAEYVFIDDRSTDGSGELLHAFAAGASPFAEGAARRRVTIISITENSGPNHKQYALAKGIAAASGSLLLFTDGDCRAPPSWISAMTARMDDPRVGLVLGPVFKDTAGKGFLHRYQCFDHAVRYMYLAASTGLDAAGGGFGNNLIFRREALEAAGGYEAVPPSVTEDAALIATIRQGSPGKPHFKVRAACGAGTHILTRTESSWKRLVNQTLRWNNGGLFSTDRATRIGYGVLMLIIASGVLTVPFLPLCPGLWIFPAMVFAGMVLNAVLTLRIFGFSMPQLGAVSILLVLFIPCYFTFLTILGILGVKAHWAGADLSNRRFA
ncbi:MAG: glycosyltransferase [Treponema sp.]|jgi:cellulose synthase/poly-beta-1,6-N-acetylglucosamine synthase-like glycosyltransferase|nr:glycosyltransferase [Treponema sp.]